LPSSKILADSRPGVDIAAQCAGYSYQPVIDAINAKQFPKVWDPATIAAGDTEAQELFKQVEEEVKAKAGDVKIKGTIDGDFC
jgi:hypothetical protein